MAPTDLAGHDLSLFPRATAPGWYDRILEICREDGYAPPTIPPARNPEFLLGLVASGRGVAFDDGRVAGKEPRAARRPLVNRPLVLQMSGGARAPRRACGAPGTPRCATRTASHSS
ncbi:LysR substrate-binding domain-containing protein [Streptomyces sp. NPDC005322]|uniref:LysR substrate-binding domain-containing protein n=1 Tax=unclassified Streptomyces TaxID=2593676 RepID=UPI0033A56BB1